MIRVLLSCLFFFAACFGALAQQPNRGDVRFFTVTLEPDFVATKGQYVGGQIVVNIQYISLDPLKRVRFDLPAIEGVRSEVLQAPRTRQIELEGDEGYTVVGTKVYSHDARLVIVPVDSGSVVIPPITVKGISERPNGLSVEFEEVHPQQTILVHAVDPNFAGNAWIVSRNVTIEDTWSHVIEEIENGDTVQRTVALTVEGVTADELPPLTLEAADGYRVLHTDIVMETETTDAGYIAHLEQTWDIYVETEDVTYVDGIELAFWNPDLGTSETVSVPNQRIEPLKKDAMALRQRLREEALSAHQTERLGLLILIGLPAAVLVVILVMVLWRLVPTKADLRFWRDSKRSGAPLDFYRSFFSWGRHTFRRGLPVSREQISALGERAADQAARLHRGVFGPGGGAFEQKRVAWTLIWASRRRVVARFLAAFGPGISRFLFLR